MWILHLVKYIHVYSVLHNLSLKWLSAQSFQISVQSIHHCDMCGKEHCCLHKPGRGVGYSLHSERWLIHIVLNSHSKRHYFFSSMTVRHIFIHCKLWFKFDNEVYWSDYEWSLETHIQVISSNVGFRKPRKELLADCHSSLSVTVPRHASGACCCASGTGMENWSNRFLTCNLLPSADL